MASSHEDPGYAVNELGRLVISKIVYGSRSPTEPIVIENGAVALPTGLCHGPRPPHATRHNANQNVELLQIAPDDHVVVPVPTPNFRSAVHQGGPFRICFGR